MAKTGDYEVPFDKEGNLLHFASRHYGERYDAAEWRQNYQFESVMAIKSMRRGRSAKYLIWVGEDGKDYPMFIADTVDLLERGAVQEGITAPHTWTFRKRGQNYGIALAKEQDG